MSKDQLRFDGKVAIITGAGGALGKAYALLLASRGCAIVVNDLGVPMKGESSDTRPAQQVVDQIKAAGGKAIANYDNVLEGEKIVKAAIDAFGRIDIVINNAGILRDVTFLKMSQQEWDIIYKVHLEGAYRVTKAAWPYMREQKYGRIIMTSSAAGLYGNVGQANYSAAKLALVGFSNTLAKEGAKLNIYTNTIAPLAGSRMTETILPPDLVNALKPDYVAPVVAYLCHDSSKENGNIYELGAGWVSRVRFQRSHGLFHDISNEQSAKQFTAETIKAKWKEVEDFQSKEPSYPTQLNDTMQVIMSKL